MQMDRSDDAVPVDVRLPVEVVDTEARLDCVIMSAVPDEIGSALFLEFGYFHEISVRYSL